jgi:N-acetylglucosamine kinase-like BadF-type ATPase
MTSYFLGVDIGATKTHALITDDAGHALGFGWGGPGNHEAVGYAGMATALRTATAPALAMAGLTVAQLAGAGFGIGGYDWPSQEALMRATIAETLGLTAPLALVNDAVLGLLAGTTAGWGVALGAGTSNNCRGRDPQGREGRVTGEGRRFGEYGGADELVMKAVHAVAAGWSRRGPATRLAGAFVAHLGVRDVDALLEGLALNRLYLGAAAAPLVFQVAEAGDPVAQAVITWAGHELGDLAAGVIRQLGFERLSFEVVLTGSLFNGGERLIAPVRATIQAVAPGARLVRLAAPPVIGAVLLGMTQAGVPLAAVRPILVQTTTALLHATPEQGILLPPP